MKTIFQELKRDHNLQRELLAKLTSRDYSLTHRKRLLNQLKSELYLHSKLEQRLIYRPMMLRVRTRELAREKMSDHEKIDLLMDELESINMDSPKWFCALNKLSAKIKQHLLEEETQIFPNRMNLKINQAPRTLENSVPEKKIVNYPL